MNKACYIHSAVLAVLKVPDQPRRDQRELAACMNALTACMNALTAERVDSLHERDDRPHERVIACSDAPSTESRSKTCSANTQR